jgi:hypothetical protein
MQTLNRFDFQEIKANIENGIEEWSIKTYPAEHRNHLGISEIGDKCSRKLWYKFRWADLEIHDGRMRRLLARGHREEERYVNYLEAVGCKVFRFSQQLWYSEQLNEFKVIENDADLSGGTGSFVQITSGPLLQVAEKRGFKLKQYRVTGVMGHYGGSCDGIVFTPWYDQIPFIAEFKTHNTKSFTYYVQNGLKKAKPQHWAQMCSYGWKNSIQYGIYFPENKNDDGIQLEVLELDWNYAQQLEKKAEEIILSPNPPERISNNPAYQECQWCFLKDVCHNNKIPKKNCRSCKNSMPVENAQWKCSKFGLIPESFIKSGCNEWIPL